MDTEETRAKIIESATDLFKKQGCKRITMDNIANELHISKRTLYEHFETKEDLLMGCYLCLQKRIDERRRIFEKENNVPIMTALYLFKGVAHFYKHYALLIEDTRRYYPEIYNRMFLHQEFHWSEKVNATLQEAQRQGYIRPNADLQTATAVMVHFLDKVTLATGNAPSLATLGEAGFTFMRGLLSVNAIEQFDIEEQKIKKLISESEIN